ncbi:hypothetical protein TWF106_007133 [Orbilia oligospora]|uniref:Uncharacterized protein n=1 Tax=Orbilia oligospora TaxID=2813651 RepID=A0A7C8V1F1_ORBOL|nr:hypothetical protein TWF106_007133 [Orbilia oligospora]
MSTGTIHDLVREGALTEKNLLEGDRLQAINEVEPGGSMTPLGSAVLKGDILATRLLLRHGADVNKPSGTPSKTSRTRTPLWIAVSKTEKLENVGPIVKILLEENADPNIPSLDDKNTPPLLNAVKNNNIEVVMMLMSYGALPTAVDKSGMSAQKFAENKKRHKIIKAMSTESWHTEQLKAAGLVVGIVSFVIAWANTTPSQRRRLEAGAALLLAGGILYRNFAGKDTDEPATGPATGKVTRKSGAGNPAKSATNKKKKSVDNISKSPNGVTAKGKPVQRSGTAQKGTGNINTNKADVAGNPNKPAAVNLDRPENGSSKIPAGNVTGNGSGQFNGNTQSDTDNTRKKDIGSPAQTATNKTNLPADTNEPVQPSGTAQPNVITQPSPENVPASDNANLPTSSSSKPSVSATAMNKPEQSNGTAHHNGAAQSNSAAQPNGTQLGTDNDIKAAVTGNPTQSAIDNDTNRLADGSPNSPFGAGATGKPAQFKGPTQSYPSHENTTTTDIGNPAKFAGETNTNYPAGGDPKLSIDGSSQTAPGNTARSATENGAQSMANETTQTTVGNTNQHLDDSSKPLVNDTITDKPENTNGITPSVNDHDDAVETGDGNPTQPAAHNKNQPGDNGSDTSSHDTTQTAAGNTAESATRNGAETIATETTKTSNGSGGQPADNNSNTPSGNNTQTAIENAAESATKDGAQDLADETIQPPIDNKDEPADGELKPPTDDTTQPTTGTITQPTETTNDDPQAIVDETTQPLVDNTSRSADGDSKSSVDDINRLAAGDITEPVIENDPQAIKDTEATRITTGDIPPPDNNATQPGDGDNDGNNDDDNNNDNDGDDDGDDDDDSGSDSGDGTLSPLSGALINRFGTTGTFGDIETMSPELRELMLKENVVEFKKGINEYITKSGLNRFFPPDDPFLQTVINKALELEKDPENVLDVRELTKLTFYKTVLYLDGEGIELRFINAPTNDSYSKPSLSTIDKIISELVMWGWTPIGTSLKGKILMPLVYEQVWTEKFERPMLVTIITDGFPEGPKGPRGRKTGEKPDTFKKAILECGEILKDHGYESNDVLFQISQIGTEEEAAKFIDGLRRDKDLDDVLYCSTDQLDVKYKELHDNHKQLDQWNQVKALQDMVE